MVTRMEPQLAPGSRARQLDLNPEQLLQVYRLMYTSRRLDDRELILKRQNRIYFQISCAGHEAIQIAAAFTLKPGYDWVFPYYRDRALCLALGMTPLDMLLQAVASGRDPSSGGRQMPCHFSSPKLNIVSPSSATGTQFVHAVGCAHASLYLHRDSDEVTLVCAGDGATSEGEFWESLNVACLDRLPVVYLIEDNGYAISVPIERQTAGGSISKLVQSFPGLYVEEVDGTDFLASYQAMKQAVEYCRSRQGPALVHAHVVRLYSHSQSDDESLYKTEEERQLERQRDPLRRYPAWLIEEGLAAEDTLEAIRAEVEDELLKATDEALAAEPPSPEAIYLYLYSDKVDPTSEEFEVEPKFSGEPRTMVDEINLTLAEEMRRDPRILVFGEDVADCSREENLDKVKGKGGVFKATKGLQREFGSQRCFNTPLAEASIIGRAIGLAIRGLKPIAEIQFFDYIWPAMMQIRDEMATLRWRSNNGFSCPVVIRVPIGGYLNGGSIYHSQSGEVTFTHIPGLRVVMPSTALDACGLLRTAIRCDDPVLFLEHKHLYRDPSIRTPHPGPDFTIPFGKARIVKQGTDLTIITYGAVVKKAELAAAQLERENPNWSIEIIDLRSLSPYDWNTISASVRKTGKVLVAYEDCLSWGYGAEIAARIAEELFDYLDGPVTRVAGKDTWVAYSPELEKLILPQVEDIVAAAYRLLRY